MDVYGCQLLVRRIQFRYILKKQFISWSSRISWVDSIVCIFIVLFGGISQQLGYFEIPCFYCKNFCFVFVCSPIAVLSYWWNIAQGTPIINVSKGIWYYFFVSGCYIGADIDSIRQITYEIFPDNGVLVCSRYCKWAGMSNPGDFILLSVWNNISIKYILYNFHDYIWWRLFQKCVFIFECILVQYFAWYIVIPYL